MPRTWEETAVALLPGQRKFCPLPRTYRRSRYIQMNMKAVVVLSSGYHGKEE